MHSAPWLLGFEILGLLASCQHLEKSETQPTLPVASAAPSVQSPIVTLGQTAELPSYRAKLVSQRDCAEASAVQNRRATRTWAAELEITNTGTEPLAVNPFYASLQDDQKYSYTTSLRGCTPLLPAKLLVPKETVRGYVPFELPRAVPNVTLSYQPVMRGSEYQVARFRIEL